MLYEQTSANALDVWRTYADAFNGELRIRRGDVSAGIQLLDTAVSTLRERGFVLYLTSFLGVLGEALSSVGERRNGLALIDEALGWCDRSGEAWCLAELWRLKGLVLGPEAYSDGEACLRRALEIARGQRALSWELRAANSLGQLYAERGDYGGADAILSPILARFTEGFDRPDLIDAQKNLVRWRASKLGEASPR
jgi:predicted ATPase